MTRLVILILCCVSLVARANQETQGGFEENTLILTKVGYVAIKEIRTGDEVLSCDVKNGFLCVYRKVENIHIDHVETLVRLQVDGVDLYVNPNHNFFEFSAKRWKRAEDLKPNEDFLINFEGELLGIEDIEIITADSLVFDLTIEDLNTYYVSDAGLLVHNFAIVIPIATWVIGEGVVWGASAAALAVGIYVAYKEHENGARSSTKDKHEKGQSRKKKDKGGEKKDSRMPYRRK
ncbi:MAG: hypothetical protein HYW48_00240 [Deltaproteobacteria bacterium]|nr:hypothetical protein [Deltaproteobacteria bacterium]